MSFRSVVLVALLFLIGPGARAEDWPNWRGPSRNGISAESDWTAWGDGGPKTAWRAQVGVGFSSIVVADGRVFTVGFADDADTVVCLDADSGKEIWKHTYPSELGDKFFEGGTTGTPTVDGDRVYFLSRWGDLFCFGSADGKVIWNTNIQKEHGLRLPAWGFGGAPLVHDNLLILSAGESGLALEKASGKLVWKSANKDAGYTTPLPAKLGDQIVVLLASGQAYLAIDPKTGKEAWRHRWVTQFGVNAADPIVAGSQVFISSGYGKGCVLLELPAANEPPKEVWKSRVLRTQMNAAVLLDGHLYGVDGDTTEKASLKCVELKSGDEKWVHPGFGSGTVIAAGGRLITLSGSGELSVAPATPEGFKPLARSQLLGGKCWTVPVLANSRLYCRNWKGQIVCVDLRK